jgi:hypothetical protein
LTLVALVALFAADDRHHARADAQVASMAESGCDY